jgi:hypothetical protein
MKKIAKGCSDCPNAMQTSFDMLSPICWLTKRSINFTIIRKSENDVRIGVQDEKPDHCPLQSIDKK